jgi:hypothetical protein
LICRNVNGLFGLKSGYSVIHNSLENADCQWACTTNISTVVCHLWMTKSTSFALCTTNTSTVVCHLWMTKSTSFALCTTNTSTVVCHLWLTKSTSFALCFCWTCFSKVLSSYQFLHFLRK